MPHYYFDCSSRSELIADLHGVRVEDERQARARAKHVARLVMASGESEDDWYAWAVEVCDEGGTVMFTVPFSQAAH